MPYLPQLSRNFRASGLFAAILLIAPAAFPQALPTAFASDSATSSASTNGAGPSGIVPVQRGFNASLGTSSQHDSSNGWSSLLTPGVAYRFNQLFSVNAGIPIYSYINIDETKGTKAKPVYVEALKHGVLGDTSLAGQLNLSAFVDYTNTVTLGLPTGNSAYGLGAGQPTYNINNHFEKSFGPFTPDIELGIGDSSGLIGARIRKAYTAVGTLANFQAGSSIDLPFNMSFEADGYEELPIAPSTLYSTTGKGKKKVTTATGESVAEDNGITTSLDIPLNGHVTLSGFYNRSIRSSDDVAGFSFTFLLKAPPKPEETAH